MNTLKIKESLWRTWLWILFMISLILGVGYFTFIVVSDKGIPSWDYRPVNSTPSASIHATYDENPAGQHIRGRGGN